MTLDPQEVVDGVAQRAHEVDTSDPPRLLGRSAEPPPPLSPVRQSEEVQTVHRHWAASHSEGVDRDAATGGVLARVTARLTTVATDIGQSRPQADRALIGDLIRAVDAVAARTDQLADRLAAVESLVPEMVAALGEDLVRLRAALERTAARVITTREGPPESADRSAGAPPGG